MINKNADLLPAEYIERAKKLGSAELCDAINTLGYEIPNSGCMAADMNAVDNSMFAVGTAVTIETKDGDNFPIHLTCYNENSSGYVLVIDGGNCRERAYAGDLIFSACKAVGYEGFIIDGCTRDKVRNIELGFPVWSRGFIPNSPIKKSEGNVNVPICCAGVRVSPGDLVVGDADGVCVVPRDIIPQVLAKAEEKELYEEKRRIAVSEYVESKKQGQTGYLLTPQWVLNFQSKT